MDVRQVFGAPHEGYRVKTTASFCPRCGSPCEEREASGILRSACTKCSYIHYVNPVPAVSVLVTDADDRLLLGKRIETGSFGGRWCLPCGVVEYHEDFLTAGIREVLEETGVQCEIKGLISAVSNFFDNHTHSMVIVLLAKAVGGAAGPSDEMSEVGWFGPHDELPPLAFESDLHIMRRYWATKLQGAPVDPRFVRLAP